MMPTGLFETARLLVLLCIGAVIVIGIGTAVVLW